MDLGVRRIARTAGHAAVAGVLLLLAGLAVLAAIGLAGAALWAITVPSLGSAGASLAVAGAFLALALILLLGAWLALKAGKRPVPAPEPVDAMLASIASIFNKNRGAVMLASVIAGLVAEQARRRK